MPQPNVMSIKLYDAERIYRTRVSPSVPEMEELEQFLDKALAPHDASCVILLDDEVKVETREFLIEDAVIQYVKNEMFYSEKSDIAVLKAIFSRAKVRCLESKIRNIGELDGEDGHCLAFVDDGADGNENVRLVRAEGIELIFNKHGYLKCLNA